jgi:hypothetical protein
VWTEARAVILPPTTTVLFVEYGLEWVRRHILRDALDDLRGPALVASVGVVLATVAGVWGLWLPLVAP